MRVSGDFKNLNLLQTEVLKNCSFDSTGSVLLCGSILVLPNLLLINVLEPVFQAVNLNKVVMNLK